MTTMDWWPIPAQRSWRRHPEMGRSGPASGIWWLNPILITLSVPMLTLLMSLLFTDADFRRLWRSPKVLTGETVALLVVGLLALCVGAAAVMALSPVFIDGPYPLLADGEIEMLLRVSRVLLAGTLVGYGAFLVQAVRVGVTPAELVTAFTDGEVLSTFEERVVTIPGVSTLTQLGVAFVVVAGLLLPYVRASPAARQLRVGIAIVLFAALLRAFYLTERLALLELFVPLMAVLMARGAFGTALYRRMRTLPLMLGPVVLGVFAVFEFTRSWTWYRVNTDATFGRFIIERFAGYYVTAYNNGQIRLDHEYDGGLPTNTLEGLWAAPGVEQVHLYRVLTGVDPMADYTANLQRYGNPEFNNESGVLSPFVDYGQWGGIVYLAMLGLLFGWLYARYRRRSPVGLLLYPLAFLSLLEAPRYLWFTQGRALVPLVALVVIAAVMHRRRRRERAGATASGEMAGQPADRAGYGGIAW